MLAEIAPSRLALVLAILLMIVPLPVAVVILRLGVVWRIIALRRTSARGPGSKPYGPGRAACAGWITGTGRACGAVGIATGGKATVW